jgi:hypothetical protein
MREGTYTQSIMGGQALESWAELHTAGMNRR